MKTSSVRLLALLAALHPILLIACGTTTARTFPAGGFVYTEDGATEWELPAMLREVSGLTMGPEDRLFAHDDERAVVHEIDYARGGIVKSFALGNPAVRGDFEGITAVDGRLALTTSDGDLYLADEGADAAHVSYELIRTGLGKRCEIEGVEYVPTERLLYFACKTPRDPVLEGRIALLAWSLEQESEVPDRTISIPFEQLGELPGKGPIRPSGIALSPRDGSLVLTAAKRRALLTVSPTGTLQSAAQVPRAPSLRQIEGIAIARDGTLVLGSEGKKDGGRMRVYRAAE
jgi:uncharacterized protein YjiK